jgi:hypothetical protein
MPGSIMDKIYRKVIPKLRFDNVGKQKKIVWFLKGRIRNMQKKGVLKVKA